MLLANHSSDLRSHNIEIVDKVIKKIEKLRTISVTSYMSTNRCETSYICCKGLLRQGDCKINLVGSWLLLVKENRILNLHNIILVICEVPIDSHLQVISSCGIEVNSKVVKNLSNRHGISKGCANRCG